MIVGFTITDFKGHEKEAIEYISRVCILENSDIAQNIVNAGPGVNVFSDAVVLSELYSQPFSAIPIELKEGKFILVSLVNFNLELSYNNDLLRLMPTEYIYIEADEVLQFIEYIKQGLVKVIPEINVLGQEWILKGGSWDDNGVWIDSNYWRDSNE